MWYVYTMVSIQPQQSDTIPNNTAEHYTEGKETSSRMLGRFATNSLQVYLHSTHTHRHTLLWEINT